MSSAGNWAKNKRQTLVYHKLTFQLLVIFRAVLFSLKRLCMVFRIPKQTIHLLSSLKTKHFFLLIYLFIDIVLQFKESNAARFWWWPPPVGLETSTHGGQENFWVLFFVYFKPEEKLLKVNKTENLQLLNMNLEWIFFSCQYRVSKNAQSWILVCHIPK